MGFKQACGKRQAVADQAQGKSYLEGPAKPDNHPECYQD